MNVSSDSCVEQTKILMVMMSLGRKFHFELFIYLCVVGKISFFFLQSFTPLRPGIEKKNCCAAYSS